MSVPSNRFLAIAGLCAVALPALGVMTTAGLVSATLIGLANTALKLVGAKVSEVTVGGLILATTLLFRGVVRPRLEIDTSRWWPLMRVAIPVGVALVFQVTLFRVDAVSAAAPVAAQKPAATRPRCQESW